MTPDDPIQLISLTFIADDQVTVEFEMAGKIGTRNP